MYLVNTTTISNVFLRFNCIIVHATVLKENAENARILAKILSYTLLMKSFPLLIGASSF